MKRVFLVMLFAVTSVIAGCRSYDLETERGQARFGVEAARMDLWREARFRFQRAVEMNPEDARNWSNLAVAYEGTGEYDLARDAYLKALQIDRSNEYVQRNYSRFLEHYGKGDEEKKTSEPKDAGEPASDDTDPATGQGSER